MTAAGCIPFIRLDILPGWTMLQIQITPAVEYMQMNYRMQYLASVMGMTAGNSAQDVAHFIYYRKFLVLIIYHRFSYYKVPYSSE